MRPVRAPIALPRGIVRTVAAAAIGYSFFTGAAVAQDGEPVRLSYEAYVGPFYVMSAKAELRLAGADYRVATKAQSEGILSWFFEWRSEARSEGGRAGLELSPRRHAVDGRWNGEKRRIRLAYPGAGRIEFDVSPPPDGNERDPVPPELTVNTVDPLSATLKVLLGIARGGVCEGQFRVFDGRRRFDMTVLAGGRADLPRLHSSVFAGPAQRCEFRLKRIAGFWKNRDKPRRQVKQPVLWVASPMRNVPPVPVRFNAETDFGDLRIHLVRVERGKRILSIPENRGS